MDKKSQLMDKPRNPMDKPGKVNEQTNQTNHQRDNQRGIGVTELLITAASIGAAILFAAGSDPKLPPGWGD